MNVITSFFQLTHPVLWGPNDKMCMKAFCKLQTMPQIYGMISSSIIIPQMMEMVSSTNHGKDSFGQWDVGAWAL